MTLYTCKNCGHEENSKTPITTQDKIEVICNYFKVELFNVMGKSQKRKYCYPRHVIMFFLAKNKKKETSLESIGYLFNKRDHTTVINACNKIKGFLDVDDKVREDVENIIKLLA